MDTKALTKLTMTELRDRAKAAGVKNGAQLKTKDELARAIVAASKVPAKVKPSGTLKATDAKPVKSASRPAQKDERSAEKTANAGAKKTVAKKAVSAAKGSPGKAKEAPPARPAASGKATEKPAPAHAPRQRTTASTPRPTKTTPRARTAGPTSDLPKKPISQRTTAPAKPAATPAKPPAKATATPGKSERSEPLEKRPVTKTQAAPKTKTPAVAKEAPAKPAPKRASEVTAKKPVAKATQPVAKKAAPLAPVATPAKKPDQTPLSAAKTKAPAPAKKSVDPSSARAPVTQPPAPVVAAAAPATKKKAETAKTTVQTSAKPRPTPAPAPAPAPTPARPTPSRRSKSTAAKPVITGTPSPSPKKTKAPAKKTVATPTPPMAETVAPMPANDPSARVGTTFTPYTPRSIPGSSEDHALGELPLGYDETRINVQVRDPHWAYCYWEVSQATRRNLAHELTGDLVARSIYVLRIYDVTGIVFDGHNAHGFHDIQVFEGANNWYLNLGRPNRSYVVDLGLITPGGSFLLIARSNQVHTPRDSYSETIDEQYMVVNEATYQEIYRLSGGYRAGASSGEQMNRESPEHRMLLDLSSGGVSSLASGGARPMSQPRDKDFRLVVDTELIVYGATEPDATVTLQGKPVQLRPDGTFTVRFALPNGCQELTVHAVNRDGDRERTITPVVERTTR